MIALDITSTHTARAPLLAIHRGRAEARAGSHSASICIRDLDDVSVAVHEGELVVLHGGVASGANALFHILSGARVLQGGVRTVAPHVRIVRATISARAFAAIHESWPHRRHARVGYSKRGRSRPTDAPPRDAHRDVFLFRVRPSVEHADTTMMDNAWRAWAHVVRQRGGAIVACISVPPAREARAVARIRADALRRHSHRRHAFDDSEAFARRSLASHHANDESRVVGVHEAALAQPYRFTPAPQSFTPQRAAFAQTSVRHYTLACGKLFSAAPATRRWSTGHSDEAVPPNACHPSSTASTGS